MREHISSIVSKIKSFEVVLQGITPVKSFGNYLFLGIQKGSEEIIKLHEKLYTGILEAHYPEWLKHGKFLPHMTVGCLNDDESFRIAANYVKNLENYFKTIVNEVSVEIIDENED